MGEMSWIIGQIVECAICGKRLPPAPDPGVHTCTSEAKAGEVQS